MADPGTPPDPIRFNASPAPTVGIEVETWLVDADTGELVPVADDILDAARRR